MTVVDKSQLMIKNASEGFIFVRRFVGSSNGHFGNEPANLQGHKISLMIRYLLIIKLNLTFDLLIQNVHVSE